MIKTYKLIVLLLFFGCQFSIAQDKTPIILKTPTDWRYEKIDLPLDFAPSIKYKNGFEELRFAPGMFDTKAEKYFSYAFVIAINDNVTLPKRKAKQLLYKYYRGLCYAVANSKKMAIDTSKIKIDLKRQKKANYTGTVVYFDTFNSGEELLLNIDLDVVKNKKTNTSYIIGLVSPKSKKEAVWSELYAIRNSLDLTGK